MKHTWSDKTPPNPSFEDIKKAFEGLTPVEHIYGITCSTETYNHLIAWVNDGDASARLDGLFIYDSDRHPKQLCIWRNKLGYELFVKMLESEFVTEEMLEKWIENPKTEVKNVG